MVTLLSRCLLHTQEADDDGSGELDIDEFVDKLGPYLGKDLTRVEI